MRQSQNLLTLKSICEHDEKGEEVYVVQCVIKEYLNLKSYYIVWPPPFLRGEDTFRKTEEGGIGNFPQKGGIARNGDPLRKGGWHGIFFFWSGMCIFLYFCTFNGEICSIYNVLPISKAILVWYLSAMQSKPCINFQIRKARKPWGIGIFQEGGGCQKGGII